MNQQGRTDKPASPQSPGTDNTDAGRNLPLPHERDQASGHANGEPQAVMQQAKRDIDAGQVDTDMRSTPGLDSAHREQLVPGTPPHRSNNQQGTGAGGADHKDAP